MNCRGCGHPKEQHQNGGGRCLGHLVNTHTQPCTCPYYTTERI